MQTSTRAPLNSTVRPPLNLAVSSRVALAIAICAALIVLDAMWDDIFFADFKSFEMIETKSPSGEVIATGIAHIFRTPSALEATLRIATPLFALAGVGAYVAFLVPRRKVAVGGLASALGAFLAISIVQLLVGYRFNSGFGRYVVNSLIWSTVSFGIGALASWAATAWWPNKSLERMYER